MNDCIGATATLSLHPDHLADLRKSGLSDNTIRAAGVYSVRPCDLSRLIGFAPPGVTSALAFPYLGDGGFTRVKVFPSYSDKLDHTVKYLQKKGTGARLYIPPGCEAVLGDASIPLAVTEGEKKALKLTQEGTLALGTGGLWNWYAQGEPIPDLDRVTWTGRLITMIPDSDVWPRPDLQQPVYAFGKELEGRGATVLIAVIPHGEQKQGIDDYLQAGGAPQTLETIPLTDPCFTSAARWWDGWRQRADRQAWATPESPWPTLAQEALYGLPGEIVAAIDPYTEADPVAVLMQFLCGFGNLIGDTPHFRVTYTRHPARLFEALVGETAKARKGTSWSPVKHALALVDEAWAKTRVSGGLSSGEGLIDAVRDPRYEKQAIREKGRVVDYQEVLVDEGIADKRLLLIEEELASVLKVMTREGNILSPILRQAWDSGDLHPLTKSNKIVATGAHVSIIGHITKDELLRLLNETEQGNGFANRFIWVVVKRSKCLPNPKPMPDERLSTLVEKLKNAVAFAATVGEVARDAEADEVWAATYPVLSEGRPGLTGAILARAEAQVMRLALCYALLDCSRVIRLAHINAAIALWDYAEASARYIFGDKTGNPCADRILSALRSHGAMSETDLSALFHRNTKAARIYQALDLLQRARLIHSFVVEETGGRKKTMWEITN